MAQTTKVIRKLKVSNYIVDREPEVTRKEPEPDPEELYYIVESGALAGLNSNNLTLLVCFVNFDQEDKLPLFT